MRYLVIVWGPGYPREEVGAVLPPNFSEGRPGWSFELVVAEPRRGRKKEKIKLLLIWWGGTVKLRMKSITSITSKQNVDRV